MGLDYFTVDTDIDSDPKIMDLIQEGDSDAWTVYSWSLIKIFRNGYFIEKDTLVRVIAWTFRSLSRDRIRECLDLMAEAKLINRGFYENEKIVTGTGIQKRYWEVAKNRSARPDMTYWLLDVGKNDEDYDDPKQGYDDQKRSFQGSKPHFQSGKNTKEKEKEKVKKEKEKRKENPASSGWASDSKKPPAGKPDPECPICGGLGFELVEQDGKVVSVPCRCRKEG